MYAGSKYEQEICTVVEEHIENLGAAWCAEHKDRITNDIINRHCDIEGDDADFYIFASRQTIFDTVGRMIMRQLYLQRSLQTKVCKNEY